MDMLKYTCEERATLPHTVPPAAQVGTAARAARPSPNQMASSSVSSLLRQSQRNGAKTSPTPPPLALQGSSALTLLQECEAESAAQDEEATQLLRATRSPWNLQFTTPDLEKQYRVTSHRGAIPRDGQFLLLRFLAVLLSIGLFEDVLRNVRDVSLPTLELCIPRTSCLLPSD